MMNLTTIKVLGLSALLASNAQGFINPKNQQIALRAIGNEANVIPNTTIVSEPYIINSTKNTHKKKTATGSNAPIRELIH